MALTLSSQIHVFLPVRPQVCSSDRLALSPRSDNNNSPVKSVCSEDDASTDDEGRMDGGGLTIGHLLGTNSPTGPASATAQDHHAAATPPLASAHSVGVTSGLSLPLTVTPSVSAAGLNFSAASLAASSSLASSMSGAADPVTGQLLADCDPARLAALSYPRLGSTGLGPMYSAAAASYPSTDQNPYPSISMENSFYGSLVRQNQSPCICFWGTCKH
jgi:hypothetical protein